MDDEQQQDVEASRSFSEDEPSESGTEAELMIMSRERRKTAGNRYSQVVAQEQANEDEEDDVALLFAEAEGEDEDEEYNSDEADDEADMSSSDDDDQGPNAAANDMEGEQEIEKQAKTERQKKRKADMAMTTMSAIRKKPKIDPTSLHRAPDKPKPSKRKERVTWLPDENTAPGRTSLRKQTVAHREVMIEKLKESEEQRLKNKAIRDEKEKQKQADAPKQLTQADRLDLAAQNERRNAKSLNRWEAMEKLRVEEQAARLAALKDRKLNGAVLTFHSSAHRYRGLKGERTSPGPGGNDDIQPRKRGPKPKKSHEGPGIPVSLTTGNFVHSPLANVVSSTAKPLPAESTNLPATGMYPQSGGPSAQASNEDWLAGIHEYASMQSSSGYVTPQEPTAPNPKADVELHPVLFGPRPEPVAEIALGPPTTLEQHHGRDQFEPPSIKTSGSGSSTVLFVDEQSGNGGEPAAEAHTKQTFISLARTLSLYPSVAAHSALTRTQGPLNFLLQPRSESAPSISNDRQSSEPIDPPPPIIEVLSTRNVLVLEDFDELAADARRAYSVLFNTKKQARPVKHNTELCAVTGSVAKYRDPSTGVPYANMLAFRKLKEIQKHGYQWSSMLGCFVGRRDHVARGVPEGFLAHH